jgi:hypothetical protein
MAYAARSELDDLSEFHGIPVNRLPPPPSARENPLNVAFNTISVTDSQIASLNTGYIGAVDGSVTVLRSTGHAEIAAAVKALTEAVIRSSELDRKFKNEILELLGTLSEEATAPKHRRRMTLITMLMSRLSELISGASAASELWLRCRELFSNLFGL